MSINILSNQMSGTDNEPIDLADAHAGEGKISSSFSAQLDDGGNRSQRCAAPPRDHSPCSSASHRATVTQSASTRRRQRSSTSCADSRGCRSQAAQPGWSRFIEADAMAGLITRSSQAVSAMAASPAALVLLAALLALLSTKRVKTDEPSRLRSCNAKMT